MAKKSKLPKHQQKLKELKKDERQKKKISEDAAQICMDVLGVVPTYVMLEFGWKKKRLTKFIQRYQKIMYDVNTHKVSVDALSAEIHQQTGIRYDKGDWYCD